MKKNDNFLSVLIKAGMPVVAIVGLVLSQFVTFGAEFSFGVRNTTKMIVCAVALFFFYVPIRDIFLQTFNGSKRTEACRENYETAANYACDNRTKQFKAFCEVEYEERKKKALDGILRNTDFTFETFRERYKFDADAVKADAALSKRDRRACLFAIREEKRIKPEGVDTILPSGKKHPTEHRRVTANPDGLSRRTLTLKGFTSVVSCVVFVSIGLSLVEGTTAVEIVTSVVMLLAMCLWQAFSAYTAARKINAAIVAQLTEKTMFLLEFEEWLERAPKPAQTLTEPCSTIATEQPAPADAENGYTVTITPAP